MSLFEVGNYVIIDDIYMGKIIKKIWNGYGYIVKLDNDPNYIDYTIAQYKLLNDILEDENIKGYMLVKSNNKMRLINKNNLINLVKEEIKKEKYIYIEKKINENLLNYRNNELFKINTDILDIKIVEQNPIDENSEQIITTGMVLNNNLTGGSRIKKTKLKGGNPKIKPQINIIGEIYNPYIGNRQITETHMNIIPRLINTATIIKEKTDITDKYKKEDINEDNYNLYMHDMINKLFTTENEIDYTEIFDDDKLYAMEAERLNVLEEGQRLNVIKPGIKAVLEKFEKIDPKLYLDLTNTLLYKHIITDNKIDNVSFGIQLIKKIKNILINIQKSIKFEDGRNLLDEINLFGYLKFKISDGYIILENENYDLQNIQRVISKEIVPDLKLLESQYNQPINYKILSNIILKNKTTQELQYNKDIVIEALNILAQDYFICLQPKVEYLLWCLTRLILCWYAEPILNENIFKIKILINLYRARGIKEFNKDMGVQPVILIVPKYGRDSALKILSHLSYYFFPYKNVGWKDSSPSFFNKVDDLIYYTNGSIDLKKYIKYLLKTGNKIISPISNDFTKIDLPNDTNDIELKLPIV